MKNKLNLDGNILKVDINATRRFQKILGFGGAFTDAAGINLYRLSEETQQKFLETYFGEKGIFIEFTHGLRDAQKIYI